MTGTNSSLNLNARLLNGGNRPLSVTLANHVFYYPTPSHLNYNWSFGSLVGLFFALQIVTGIFLAMHYTPHVEWAFTSVEHIMTDVNGGQFFRYFHANGASAVFILMYAHIARNLYYQSYLTRRNLWYTGLVIFLLMMATAFIGYVLPWGQMSFWGATVITSLVTAVPLVGEDIAYWVWGGFSINNATLTRFFSLHYLLPFLITGIIGLHLVMLHTTGSSDPLTLPTSPDKLTFHPYFTYKDAFIFLVTFAAFGALTHYAPNLLGHSDNFLPANPLVTPAHIVPEWYFTPFYAILRACPNKLGGAIGMFAAILLLFFVPFYVDSRTTSKLVFAPYSDEHKIALWGFIGVFLTLMFLGSRAAAAPYVLASKLFTALYFTYFLVVLPTLALLGESSAKIVGKRNDLKTLKLCAYAISFKIASQCSNMTNTKKLIRSTIVFWTFLIYVVGYLMLIANDFIKSLMRFVLLSDDMRPIFSFGGRQPTSASSSARSRSSSKGMNSLPRPSPFGGNGDWVILVIVLNAAWLVLWPNLLIAYALLFLVVCCIISALGTYFLAEEKWPKLLLWTSRLGFAAFLGLHLLLIVQISSTISVFRRGLAKNAPRASVPEKNPQPSVINHKIPTAKQPPLTMHQAWAKIVIDEKKRSSDRKKTPK